MELNEVRKYLRDELIPDKHEHGKYICPLCGSGSGGSGHDGAFSIDHDGIHGKCFSCGFYGDIFDLEAAKTGQDLAAATRDVMARYDFAPVEGSLRREATQGPAATEAQDSAPHTFKAYLDACHASLKDSAGEEYLRRRGITDQTMERFNLGFGTDLMNRPCIVMPHDRRGSYYTTRTILENVDKPHMKPRGGKSILFNTAALYQPEPCFIVESQLCAISIMQEGGSAFALCGLGEVNKLLDIVDRQRPSAMLILALDNDPLDENGNKVKGPEAQEKLAAALTDRNIPFLEFNVAGECKDPNELLQKNPEELRGNIAAAVRVATLIQEESKRQEQEDYEAQTTVAAFDQFEKYLDDNRERPPVPTGFNTLDGILNGGLSSGLYIMGAISSLGKTSWMLNIADNMAAAGRDVLYFSLEMSKYELIAKSISRISFQIVCERSLNTDYAMTTFDVMNSRGHKSLTAESIGILHEAFDRYKATVGKHFWIFSGVSKYGVDDIVHTVEEHIRITGRSPIVFIDYLQILAPEDTHLSDKQNTDRAVVKLKNMSSSLEIPVFCISSLNRSNYSEPINMAAFKESGAIEYGSDVLIGIQLYGIDRRKGEKDNDRAARIAGILKAAEEGPQADLEVKVLKNRNGKRGGSGRLLFDKAYNFFHEIPKDFDVVSGENPFDDGPEQQTFKL